MPMTVVGITGGIGAGKSMVSRVLRCKRFEVYDCDLEARRLMDASAALKEAIAGRLGAECLSAEGELNRAGIARIIFGDESHRLWLNSVVHEMVHRDLHRRVESNGDGVLFIESAILRTSRLDSLCDRIWLVDAPEEVRLSRACGRDSADAARIRARMEAQRDEFGDFGDVPVAVICNDGVAALLPQIENQLKLFKQIHYQNY